jgi:tetratricopeptide (TPR) repeat protein
MAHEVKNNGTYYLNNHELTLAEIFKDRGYQTSAIIASFTLFSKFGLNQGFDFYDESFNSQKMIPNFLSEITADKVYDKFTNWLHQYDDQKFFIWIHFYDPHYPYLPHPEIDAKFDHSNWMKYYGEIAFADLYVGNIIQALRSKNLLDRTLVVIVGDHGEAFGEHREYGHGIFCYEESLKVPLIFYNSRLFKKRKFIDNRVSIVDIMPTILEIYNFDIPSAIQGKSFAHLIRGKKDNHKRLIYFESMYGKEKNNWAPLTGFIENDYKYISLPEPELYDLKNDLPENNNLFTRETKLAKNLDKKLMQFVSDYSDLPKSSRRKLSPSDIQKLKSLGYISSFSNKTSKMIDPKKGYILYAMIEEIKEKIKEGLFYQAEKELNQLISENPGISLPNFYQASYEIKKNTGRASEAMAILEKGLENFPDNEEFKIQLALFFLKKKQWKKTEKLCSQLLEYNPLFAGAYILLGDINESKNNIKDAILNYEEALKIEPQNELAKVKYAYLLSVDNQHQKAMSILSELQKNEDYSKNPALMEIMVEIGILFTEKNELESALSLLTKVLEISPSNPEVRLNLGTVFLKYGQLDKALENYRKAIDIDPDFAIAYSNLGMLYFTRYLESNDYKLRDEALENFNKAIQLNSDIADAYNGRGAIYFALYRIDEAILDFKKSIELKPDYFDAYINISVAFRQLGQKKEALKYLNLYKKNYYHQLSANDQHYLNQLISELIQN